MTPVLKVDVYRLPEHVVENLEDLLDHERVFVRGIERVIASLPRQREGERVTFPGREQRTLHRLVPLRDSEAHHHVLRSKDDRQASLEVRTEVQRREGPFADDDGVHELDRDVLGVGRGRAVAESQKPPSSEKPARHLVAGLG